MRLIKRMYKFIYHLGVYLFAKPFSLIFYDRKYLTGKYFANGIFSRGWIWAAKDIGYRLRTRNHLSIPYPVGPNMVIHGSRKIIFHPDDLNNFQGYGCYFQVSDESVKIIIGKGSYIAQNVGLITTNHDILNLDEHIPGKSIVIGEKCWIGMNSVILPGVRLGDQTIVGAGSIVTKSFEKGHCIIAGNPAKIIKEIA